MNKVIGTDFYLWYVSENECEEFVIKKFMDYFIKRTEDTFKKSKELREILDSLEKLQK